MIIENPLSNEWASLVKRPEMNKADLDLLISEVYDSVRKRGDEAVREYTKKFEGKILDRLDIDLEDVELSSELKEAIDLAAANITTFHKSQELELKFVETTPGVICWQESRPLSKVGLYIPGGTAPLFSSVLMLAIPAKIAGCNEIIMTTPTGRDGKVHPAMLYAAKVAGVTKIFTIGGAQAIAALCLGTESVPKVQKIFGPGNQYVTAAKKHALSLGTPIDMPAGPSELLVMASENSTPKFVAADLLSQAEHGRDSQVICLATSKGKLEQIIDEVNDQMKELPRRDMAAQAIDQSKFIVLKNQAEMIAFSNLYAPEHLIIADELFESYISDIQNAGSVFLGNYCPESAGDYASGTNHTLPTSGFAHVYSGVNLDAFVKKITFQKISKEGIRNLGPSVEVMAEAEGLQAHKNAVTFRLDDLNNTE